MPKHNTEFASPVSKFKWSIIIITFFMKKKKNVVNLLPFHQVSYCSYIIFLSENEGKVASNNFTKTFVTLLTCILCCPTCCHMIYINSAPPYICVQVCYAPGKELSLCMARLGSQVSTGKIKWKKGSLHLLWAAKHCLVQDTSVFKGWKTVQVYHNVDI